MSSKGYRKKLMDDKEFDPFTLDTEEFDIFIRDMGQTEEEKELERRGDESLAAVANLLSCFPDVWTAPFEGTEEIEKKMLTIERDLELDILAKTIGNHSTLKTNPD